VIDTNPRWLRLALLLVACALYVGVALTSPGYDDEFYNVDLLESGRTLFSAINFTQHWDVHPPGQFVLDAVLHALLGSWALVRAVGALACALVVVRFSGLERLTGKSNVLLHFVLVALNPALLMWCTGLRWTTWFVPLYLLAILWVRRDTPERWRFWPVLALLGLALFYLNYLALLLMPPLALVALYRRRSLLAQEWPAIGASAAVAVLLILPQLYFLVRFQLAISSSQVSGPMGSLTGMVQGLIVHVGVFPLSIVGALTGAAFVALAVWLGWRNRETLRRDPEAWMLAASLLLMLVTGLAGKWRNLVPLVPPVFASFVPAMARAPTRIGLALAWLLAASNLIGVFNVARHWETNKGSWNLPVDQTVAATRQAATSCGTGTPVVAVLDPVLAGNLAARTHMIVIGPRPPQIPQPMLIDGDYCLIQVKTYRGAIPANIYAEMQASFPSPGTQVAQLGRDPDAARKRSREPDIPEYYVEVRTYGHVKRVPDYLRLVYKRDQAAAKGIRRARDIED
jgi:hypothetical protein